MRRASHRASLFPLILFVLSACDDSSRANAQYDKAAEDFRQELTTEFEGIVTERTAYRPVSVKLQQDGEVVTGILFLGNSVDAGYLRLPLETDIPLEGIFDPLLGYLRLTTKSGARTGEVVLEMAQTPEGAVGSFAEIRRHGTKGSRRGKAIFVPASKVQHLEHLTQTLADLNDRQKIGVDAKQCPGAVRQWIEKSGEIRKNARYPGQNLAVLSIPAFKKAFGATYDKIDAAGLKKAHSLLSDVCNARPLSHLVHDAKIYKDTHYRYIEEPIVKAWWENIKALIESDARLRSAELDAIQPYFQTFQLGQYGLNYRAELAPQITARKKDIREEELRLARLDNMEKYQDRIDLMFMNARAQLNAYPDTRDLVTEKLDTYALKAAQVYADNAKRRDELQYMISFSTMVENGVDCMMTSRAQCRDIARLFEKKAEELSYELDDELTQKALKDIPEGRDLKALVEHVRFAERMQRWYGNSLGVGGLAEAWQDIVDKRRALQKDLYDEIYAMVDQSTSATPVIQIERQYFFQEDIKQSGMKKLDTLLSQKLAELAPFRDMRGGEYLNALINKDYQTLRTLDQEYTQGYSPFVALAGDAMSMISPAARQDFSSLAKNMTAVNVIFATYMLDYQTRYPDCMGANPFTATVSTTTTETRKDGYGFELSRTSWTTEDEYTVPARLATHLESLWRSDFEGDSVAADALFNDQKIGILVNAMRTVTNKLPCDHPHIKALENGMISYYRR